MLNSIGRLLKNFFQFALKAVFVFVLVIGVIGIGTMIFFDRAQESFYVDTTFSADGTAKRLVTPDIAEITIGTYVQGRDITSIQKQATEKINKATDAVKALEIPDEDVQTVNYNLTPEKKFESNEIESYSVNVAIKVTIRNTDPKDEMVGKVIEAATNAGLNEVRSLTFEVDNQEEILDELKVEAIDNAKERAKVLAKESGLKLGKLLNMSEGYNPYYYDDYKSAASFGSAESMPAVNLPLDAAPEIQVEPGQFELSTTVTLIYEIK